MQSIVHMLAEGKYTIVNYNLLNEYGRKESLLFGELAYEFDYWYKKGKLIAGWFYSSCKNVERATGLKYDAQASAIKKLVEAGFLKVHVNKQRRFFYIDIDKLTQVMNKLTEIPEFNYGEFNPNPNEVEFPDITDDEYYADLISDDYSEMIMKSNVSKSTEKKKETKKPKGPTDNSKAPKYIFDEISNMDATDEIKNLVASWYQEKALSKITLKRIKEIISDVLKHKNDVNAIRKSIELSKEKNWLGIYFRDSNNIPTNLTKNFNDDVDYSTEQKVLNKENMHEYD